MWSIDVMARSGKTAQEFIQSSFSPIIAVLCGAKVQNAVSKNNLSFVELVQPFTTFDWEGQFREPNGTVCIVKNWKCVVRDVTWKPLQPTEARRQLNNAVLHNYYDKTVAMEIGSWKVNLSQTTPWFDAWRETYFEVQFPSDHEYTKHFLSCILVATTMDDNIVETFNELNQQFAQYQTVTPPKLPKWFNSNVLKTYLLIHDASCVAQDKATEMFETMKQHFEASSCFMLTINSKSATDAPIAGDIWAPYIRTHSASNSEVTSPTSNLPSTSPETQIGQTPTISGEDDSNFGVTTTQPETPHPLTVDSDVYDNANSLQTHSFSGSSESVSIAGRILDYSNEVHGAALNSTDIESLKKFMQDYASKALLPYIERQIATLSELVANRKGVSRSLLSATKRWFGTGKGGNTTGNNSVIYSTECPELQLRRLGDLWFMFGQWQRAFDTYHTAKREFYADGAWLCYAGALEMAALSAFMAGEANRKTHGYMEESIVTYLNTCRMVQYAVRATLLSSLCLSSSSLHGEAAKQLIRMTSEDSDLRSAMLLEQAALCFLTGPAGARAMGRKYAFHMVLAGHRFSKAGQKRHAYRCYKQAYEVYAGSGWRLSTDHVQFALGRLAGALRLPRDAAAWLAAPLAPYSPQPPQQHQAFLRDYMLAHQQWVSSLGPARSLVALPLPLLSRARTAVLAAGPAPLSAPGRSPATSVTLQDAHTSRPSEHKYWDKLERMCLQAARGAVPMIFRAAVNVFTAAGDSSPSVPQGEPIQISISLRNPLKVAIVLKDLELLWRFQPNMEGAESTDEWLCNEASVAAGTAMEHSVIYGQRIKSVVLDSECEETLTFSLTPLQVGLLMILSVAYKLVSGAEELSEVANSITIAGKIDLEDNSPFKCLSITVVPCAPCLQMTFSETSPDVISGEMRSIDVELRNVGPVGMTGLHLAVSHPDCMHLIAPPAPERHDPYKLLYEEKYSEPPTQLEERTARLVAWRAACARHVTPGPPAAAPLPPGAAARATLLLRPRTAAATLYLLAYYEPADTARAGRGYRLLRHVFRFNVREVVEVSATPRRSISVSRGAAAEKMSLAVQVKNVSDERRAPAASLRLLDASLLGKQWTLTKYVSAARNKDDTLASREKCHLVLEAARLPQPRENIQASSLKIAKGIPDSEPDISTPPYSKFVLEYNTSFIEDEDSYLRDGKVTKRGLIESMLVVRWKVQDDASGKSVIGQSCLWLDCFTKAVSAERVSTGLDLIALDDDTQSDFMSDKTKSNKENVVLVNMVHSAEINHNFGQSKLCLIPITINIVNCYAVPVNAFIDMSKKSSLGWSGALSPGAPDGSIGVRVTLAALQSRAVCVRALAAAPGTYLPAANVSVTASVASVAGPATSIAAHQLDDSSLLVVRQAA